MKGSPVVVSVLVAAAMPLLVSGFAAPMLGMRGNQLRRPSLGQQQQQQQQQQQLPRQQQVVRWGITPDGISKNMEDYRRNDTEEDIQRRRKRREDGVFTGYDLCDMIVAKWGHPYDLQISTTEYMGRYHLHINVMWKYLGQQSFHLSEQQYLEHLEAVARLLVDWGKVATVADEIFGSRKRPDPYFGYAVSIPLDLPEETILPYIFEREQQIKEGNMREQDREQRKRDAQKG